MSLELVLAVVLAVAVASVLWFVVARRRGHAEAPSAGPPAEAPAEAARERARPTEGLGGRVRALLGGRAASEVEWAALEDLLVRADVGPRPAAAIVDRVRARHSPEADPEELLIEEIAAALATDEGELRIGPGRPSVLLVVGVNGSGKTTTIGKLARRLASQGLAVGLAGSDTFRAAAAEQLETWAERAGVDVVSQERGADPGAVAFDAVKAAQARGTDVLIVDTAGRLHTKTPLMDELGKVRRVIRKAGADIDETLLVLDATTGQNGVAQARAFTEAVQVTGVALTKLDGTAKGGIVLAVRDELGVPVKLIGTGEGIDDLAPFDAVGFARRMVRG